jgi:hypothetical protein
MPKYLTGRKFLSYLIKISALLLLFSTNSCKRDNLYKAEKEKLESLLAISNGEYKIPDFSFAGFEKNEKAIPNVNVLVTVKPGLGNDGERIQQAIDKVSAAPLVNGYRGAVLLKAGTYEVNQSLNIGTSGVILRGEGQSDSGTVVIAALKVAKINRFILVNISGSGDGYQEIGSHLDIDKDLVAVGAKRIPVSSASEYRPGDTIVVVKTPNQDWINTIGMQQYGWTPKGYNISHLRIIERVDANAVWVDMPLIDAIDKKYGGGYIAKATVPGRISHCGVEGIYFKSSYDSDEDEDHAWTAVRLTRSTNCWVKNVTAQYFAFSCVSLYKQSDFNTIQDCAMLDPKSLPIGERRYSFQIDKGMGNLFQRCFTKGGRHDFVTGSRVTGPNVYLDCIATKTLDESGPHHRWATGLLFDNVTGGILHVSNRKNLGTGQGWTGAQVMWWNCTASLELVVNSPPTGVNWAVGCKGNQMGGDGEYISRGIPVTPRSLFLSQLEKRLGSEAVIRVTNQAQREGDITISLLNLYNH